MTRGSDAASFANLALAAQLKTLPASDVADRAKATVRGARNWREGNTGPQWVNVAHMLNDPVTRPLVLKAASAIAEADALDKPPRPEAGSPTGDTANG